MSDKESNLNEGYVPVKKGYQPSKEKGKTVTGGYQPEKNTGTNPTNVPPKEK